jgi:hypothetical protein
MNLKHFKSYTFLFLLMVFVMSVSTSFRLYWNSPLKGSVNPSDAAVRAWIFSRTDTLNSPVIQGNFMVSNVKPGNYILMLEAKPPYRDSFKQDVLVVDGQPTDVGVIEMHR